MRGPVSKPFPHSKSSPVRTNSTNAPEHDGHVAFVTWPEVPNGTDLNTPRRSPNPLPLAKTLTERTSEPVELANKTTVETASARE